MSNIVKPYAVIDAPTIESVSYNFGMVGGIIRDGVSRTVIIGSYACNFYYTINTASDSNNDCIAYDITIFVDKELESTILFGCIPGANDSNVLPSSVVGQLNYVNTIKCSVSIDVSSSITTEPKYISTIRESLLKILKHSIAILSNKRMVFFNVPIDPTLSNVDGPFSELEFNTKLPFIPSLGCMRYTSCLLLYLDKIDTNLHFNNHDIIVKRVSQSRDDKGNYFCVIELSIFPYTSIPNSITLDDNLDVMVNLRCVKVPCVIKIKNYDTSLTNLTEYWEKLSIHLTVSRDDSGLRALYIYGKFPDGDSSTPSITKEDIIKEADRRGITQDSESAIEDDDKFTIDDIKNCTPICINALFHAFITYKAIMIISQFADKILKILRGDKNK